MLITGFWTMCAQIRFKKCQSAAILQFKKQPRNLLPTHKIICVCWQSRCQHTVDYTRYCARWEFGIRFRAFSNNLNRRWYYMTFIAICLQYENNSGDWLLQICARALLRYVTEYYLLYKILECWLSRTRKVRVLPCDQLLQPLALLNFNPFSPASSIQISEKLCWGELNPLTRIHNIHNKKNIKLMIFVVAIYYPTSCIVAVEELYKRSTYLWRCVRNE